MTFEDSYTCFWRFFSEAMNESSYYHVTPHTFFLRFSMQISNHRILLPCYLNSQINQHTSSFKLPNQLYSYRCFCICGGWVLKFIITLTSSSLPIMSLTSPSCFFSTILSPVNLKKATIEFAGKRLCGLLECWARASLEKIVKFRNRSYILDQNWVS